MGLIKLLEQKGIVVTQINNNGEELRVNWMNKFVGKISKSVKESIYLDQFLWHVFSYEKLNCLENEEAIEAFNKQKKTVCYVFYQQENSYYKLKNADTLKAEDFNNESDVFIVDTNFNWTYVRTHEDDCGPYFYKL